MQHSTCVLATDPEQMKGLAAKLGKKGTESNIAIYYGELAGAEVSCIVPFSYPEKIEALVQCIELSDSAVLVVQPEQQLDAKFGEILILLDYFRRSVLIAIDKTECTSDFRVQEMRGKLTKIIASTSLKGSEIIEISLKDDSTIKKIREWIPAQTKEKSGPALFLTDHFFDVKGVGTVLLGILKQGSLKPYDKPRVYPLDREILVKSIQLMDVDQKEVQAPCRPGLAVKGVEISELKRGFVFSNAPVKVVSELSGKFEKSAFYRQAVSAGEKYRAAIGAQSVEATIVSLEPFKATLEKPLAAYKSEAIIFRSDIKEGLRVVGKVVLS